MEVGDRARRGRSSPGCPCRGSGTVRPRSPASRARTQLRRVAALLHRHRRDARQVAGSPSPSRTRTMSPSANTSGWPGRVRSGSTVIRPARRARRRRLGERAGERRRRARPRPRSRSRRGSAPRSPSGLRSSPTPRRSRPRCARASASRRGARASGCAAGERRREGGEHPVAASTSSTRLSPASIVRKSPRRVSRASSAICPAISTPVGPAPTTTKVSSARAPLAVGLHLGGLERHQQPRAERQRALQRLHLGRASAPLLVAEVGVARAAGDDQGVVAERLGRGSARRRDDFTRRSSRSKPVTSASITAHVLLALEDRPQRITDLRRREGAGRDLVGERLEEVEVPPVDQRQLDRGAGEVLARPAGRRSRRRPRRPGGSSRRLPRRRPRRATRS